MPNDFGVLVEGQGSYYHEQTFYVKVSNETREVHARMKTYSETNWGPWKRIDNFGCNTASELATLLGGLFYTKKFNFILSKNGNTEVTTGSCAILFITSNSWDISMIILVSQPASGVNVVGYQAGGGKTVGTTSNDSVQISHSANSPSITITSNDMDREFHGVMLSY